MKAKWIGDILHGNCLLKSFNDRQIEGGTEVMGRRGKVQKQLLDKLKGKQG